MRVNEDYTVSAMQQGRGYSGHCGSKTGKYCGHAVEEEDPAAILELSETEHGREENSFFALSAADAAHLAEKDEENKSGGVDDPTARLTKRLVVSKTRSEVLDVMSESYKALGEALKAVAGGDKEAIEVVRRLQKLIRRVNRKMSDLDKEADISRKEKRARKQELEQLARQHEMELKRRIAERKKREKKYLDDPDAQDKEEQNIQISFGAMSQAELEALMRQMMPAVMSVLASNGDIGGDLSFGSEFSGGDMSGGGMAGGDAAAQGGEISVE